MGDLSNPAIARAEQLEDTLRIFAEFGLFVDQEQAEVDIVEAVTRARQLAVGGRMEESRTAADQGELLLDRTLFERGRIWRCTFLHQLPLFLYHIAFFLFFMNAATGYLRFLANSLWEATPVPLAAATAGGMGATLRGLWFLWLKVSRREFRLQFLLAQLSAPWVGMLLGIFTFLLVKSGLLLIEGTKQAQGSTSISVLAICFFAGYNWERALEWADSVMKRSTPSSPSGRPGKPPNQLPAPSISGQPTAEAKNRRLRSRKSDRPLQDKPKAAGHFSLKRHN